MQELIDRQDALAEIDDTIAGNLQRPEDAYIDKGLMMARAIIEKLPAIESEQRRGHIEHRKHLDYCSECGAPLIGYRFYCGKCGADMREGILTMAELKPCPFCGGKAKLHKAIHGKYWVECTTLGELDFYIKYYDTPEEAIEAWNKMDRVTDNG